MDCQRRRLDWGAVGFAHPRGGREGAAPSRRAPCLSPVTSPFAAEVMDSPGRGPVRGGLGPAPAPPPDAPPSAPRSPRAPGCCLGAAAARGADCRPRCCRWT